MDHEGNFVFRLAKGLLQHGWHAHVLAPHVPGSRTDEEMEGILVKRFRYLMPEGLETVCGGGSALVTLKKQPLEPLKLPPLLISQCLHTLYLLMRNKYSLIHAHWLIPQGLLAVIAAHIFHIPAVITVHGGDVFRLRHPFFNRLKRFALKRACRVTVNSPATKKAVLELVPDLKNLYEIPMGIPDETTYQCTFTKQAQRSTGPAPFTIIFVGRLTFEKGVEDLLQAMSILLQKRRDVKLLLVGDGQEKETFLSMAKKLGIAESTEFIGAVPHEDVLRILQKADVFVAPSRITKDGWQEAQGLSIAEAMSVGIPVVATHVGGIPSMIRHKKTGLLVPSESPKELASAIEFLLCNTQKAQEMAQKAQKFISNYCGQSHVTAAFAALFEDISSKYS